MRQSTEHGLKPFDYLAPLTGALAEPEVERADPFGGLTPYGVVILHVLFEFLGSEIAGEQPLPMRIGAQAAAPPAVASAAAQQPFDRVDLASLDADKVAAA
jgi:hypothetical protein